MSSTYLDMSDLSLDSLGRVVLSDELLEQIDRTVAIIAGEGSNTSCGGSANGSCTNGSCGSSVNGSCTNAASCNGSANLYTCKGNAIEPPTNSGCA